MKHDYSARKRGMPIMSIEERLKSNMKVNPVSGCWEWTGCKRGGYGHTIVGSHHHPDRGGRVMDYITINGKRYPVSDFRFPTKPKTNADRIRAMTDEELAEWLADHPVVSKYDENNPQHKAWLDWLKQEASDGKD